MAQGSKHVPGCALRCIAFGCGLAALYYYEPNSSRFPMILGERVDKVDAMDKADWITYGVWRPRAALHVICCLVAACRAVATRASSNQPENKKERPCSLSWLL